MKTVFVVVILFLCVVSARDYNKYVRSDWWNADLYKVPYQSPEQMMAACDAAKDCIGFNTAGWLKKKGGYIAYEQLVDIYLIKDIFVPSGNEPDFILWPRPNNYESGDEIRTVNLKDLKLDINSSNVDAENAFKRMVDLLYIHKNSLVNDDDYDTLEVSISNYTCPLSQGMDESYSLLVPETGNTIQITANCIYGYYHALMTLSQLIRYIPSTHSYTIHRVPWIIDDKPFYSYRGLMIDTSRHFLPAKAIRSVIDSMAMTKLNTLHWHISDEDSFPMEILGIDMFPSSFSPYERYTIEDTVELVEYARQRGIRVIPEIDVPGHAAIWCKSDPSICPSETCLSPLNPANEHTFEVIETMVKSLVKVFPDAYFHVGGDEVNTTCWTSTPSVSDWMAAHNYTVTNTYEYFIKRVHEIVIKYSKTAIYWEEVFNNFNAPKGSIIETWLAGSGAMKRVVDAGYQGIYTHARQWYLPKLWAQWDTFYNVNPIADIEDPEKQKLVLGGELCMWGEWVDISDLEQTIYPRGFAGAEPLWTAPEHINITTAGERLAYQRCVLNWRGIAASPTFGDGRSNPVGPYPCMKQ